MKYMVRDKVFVNIMDAIYENAVTIGTGFILLLTGRYMLEGSFSVGDFSLFVYYLPFVADFAVASLEKFLLDMSRVELLLKE